MEDDAADQLLVEMAHVETRRPASRTTAKASTRRSSRVAPWLISFESDGLAARSMSKAAGFQVERVDGID